MENPGTLLLCAADGPDGGRARELALGEGVAHHGPVILVLLGLGGGDGVDVRHREGHGRADTHGNLHRSAAEQRRN